MIKSRAQLQKATDEEILQFFKTVIFRGSFSISIPSEHQNIFCGQITDITINGEQNNLCPKQLFVPVKFKQFIKDGACEFIASANLKVLRDESHSYKLLIKSIKNIIIPDIAHFDKNEEALFRRNLKLKDNLFIGQFTKNKDGSFTIRDIRRSDFSKLILQNGKEQQAIVYHPKITQPKDGKYYEFSWVLNGVRKVEYVYLFKVDETKPFKEVDAFALVKKLKDDIMSYPAGAGQKIVKMLDTLKNQLMASGKEIFIYELLQNANDYPNQINGKKEMVDVEFHITSDSLLFLHSGAKFNERNVAAICSINDKEKTDNKETIGYKGIGFKTVFLDNNYVYLQTGDFSFRFDREETRDIVDTPWQILPIWTNYNELTKTEKYIFTNAEDKFRVKFALRPINITTLRGLGQSYVKMFRDVFKNERVILFIPNLSSVKIFLKGSSIPDIECKCDSDHWQVNDYIEQVKKDITESINADIEKQEDNGSLKIPTKYYDFTQTKVSFACEISGSQLKPIEDTQLYCYLPTRASWGLKFLMNTDMIPTGPRDDIEIDFTDQININAEISEIAGEKFFDWIKSLCDLSKYTFNSIFNLIPVFDTIIREHSKYKSLIERFKKGFDSQIKSKEFIPINIHDYAHVQDVVLDETGLMSSDIMEDEDFFAITGYQGVLPIKELRNDREFKAFLRRYLKDLDSEENIWGFEDLKKICTDSDFRGWVSEQENNNHFLDFLLKKDKLEVFLEEEIFLGVDGELYKASNLYYDIDKYLLDLSSFSNNLYYLSPKTRKFFNDNKKWQDAISEAFGTFDCDKFVDDILLSDRNKADSIQKLKDKNTSICFFKFLAENVGYRDKYKSLPFFNDNDEVVDSFESRFIFHSSTNGHTVCNSDWMSSIDIQFLSNDYTNATKKYFKGNFGLQDFSDEFIIKNVIVSDDYRDSISESIDEDFDISKDFIAYCYAYKDLFENGDLRNYSLHVYDGDGNEQWCLAEDHIFFQSDLYDALSSREWIDSDWMYVLDEDYIEGVTDKTEYKKFLSSKFCIDELTAKKFYTDVVKKNIKDIIKNTSGDADSEGEKNIDFVKYLDDNYDLIFIEKKDSDTFSELVPVSTNITDLSLDDRVYIYDDELAEVIENSWFPEEVVYLCNKEYGKSRALLTIGCKVYDFREFYDNVIVGELDSINDNIDCKESSISFHSFIIDHLGSLTTDQQCKMVNAKVFLYGNGNVSATSSGHKILSTKATELFNKGLVAFSELDIIDPDYKIEENLEYWETRLGNSKFTVSDFIRWLNNNKEVFESTINNKEYNLSFWRWVKENVSLTTLSHLPVLPIFVITDMCAGSDKVIYLSDSYITDSGIETIIKKYHKDALFVSPEYIEDGDDIETWKEFWTKIGLLSEITDILINTIIPKLDEIDDEKLPATIAKYRSRLEEEFDDLPSELAKLRVKAYDGRFYAISKTLYVNSEKEEPFVFIKLPNQIVFGTADERRLIKDIIESAGGTIVDREMEWQKVKIVQYLKLQDSDNQEELLRAVHFQFIEELAKMYDDDSESLDAFDNLSRILLLNEDDEFASPENLTLSSIYNPHCDFQKYGIDSLSYTSDKYNNKCSRYIGKIFSRVFKVHHDFRKSDAQHLSNREFSIYFWSKYLIKKSERGSLLRIKELMEEKVFDDIACIPTQDFMKKPSDLYSVSITNYVKKTEDWENKLPLLSMPNIQYNDEHKLFDYLPFMEGLSFGDCLFALFSFNGKGSRQDIIRWAIKGYSEEFEHKVEEYREDAGALWTNVKNERVHIKDLYALEEENSTLVQYFGGLSHIINQEFFPGDFRKACDIFKIKTIDESDLLVDPIGTRNRNESVKGNLYLYALVIAGIENVENWQENYNAYKESLDLMNLWLCDSISLQYKDDAKISQTLKKFYHKSSTPDFYYVGSIDDKRVFKSFVEHFIDYLGVSAEQDLVEEIMDGRDYAIARVKEYNDLMLDNAFKECLYELIPEIKQELKGNIAQENDENKEGMRHTYSASEIENEDNLTEEQANDTNKDDCAEYHGGPKVHVCEHERNPPGSGNASNNSGINPMVSQTNMDKEDDVEINTAPPIPINTSSQKSKMPQDEYSQMELDEDYRSKQETDDENEETSIDKAPSLGNLYHQNSDKKDYMGSVDKDVDYQPLGSSPYSPRIRKHPKPFTKEELNRLRSKGSPLELESLPATSEEVDILVKIGISPEQIADTNYLAQLRLFKNLTEEQHEQPEETLAEFVCNANDVTTHALKGGRYIHTCSAARGIMYISPSVWSKMADDKWAICVYLDGQGKNFHYINSAEEFLKLVEKDDVVIKITGQEKVNIVNQLYNGLLDGAKGTAYTLIRVAARTNMDAVFAHYVGSMAEADDGNEGHDSSEF